MESIESLSPREFEEFVAAYLRDRGYRTVERVGGAGDLGVDIRCTDEHGRLVVVQCKHYTSGAKVGSPEIQHFFGMVVHAGAARGIFATSSAFTTPAVRLAEDRDIELIDGAAIRPYWADTERRKREVAERLQQVTAEHRRRQSEALQAPTPAPNAAVVPLPATRIPEVNSGPPQWTSTPPNPKVTARRSGPGSEEPFSLGLFLFVCLYVFWFLGIGPASAIGVTLLLANGHSDPIYVIPLVLATLTFLVLPFAADIWIHFNVTGTNLVMGLLGSTLNAAIMISAASGVFLLQGHAYFGIAAGALVTGLLILQSQLAKRLETLPEEEWPKWIKRAYVIARLLAVAGLILWGVRAFS